MISRPYQFSIHFRHITIAFACLMLSIQPGFSEESILISLQKTSGSVVSIKSVAGAVYGNKPQGIFDKSTGQMLIVKKIRPVTYTRVGAGILLNQDGVIVTNAHTVRQAGKLMVTLKDQTEREARILHLVSGSDIAFIKIDPPFPFTQPSFADSSKVKLGAKIYTISNSTYLKGSISQGKVTGLGIPKGQKPGGNVAFLRLNLGLYQGDSGSPILDEEGKIVGIIAASQANKNTVTYAIPSNAILLAYQNFLGLLEAKDRI